MDNNTELVKTVCKLKTGEKGYFVRPNGFCVVSKTILHNKCLHRLLMEKHLGRKLESGEEVYHLDGNRLNNNISNLNIRPLTDNIKSYWRKRKAWKDDDYFIENMENETQSFLIYDD